MEGTNRSWPDLYEVLNPGLACFDCDANAKKLLLGVPFFRKKPMDAWAVLKCDQRRVGRSMR